MDDLQDKFARIIAVLQERFPERLSRWNGVIVLEAVAHYAGILRPSGEVGILWAIAQQGGATLYRTLIHEALHTFSTWTPAEYREARGWEEGVVEKLQRLLRQPILDAIGVAIPESEFVDGDEQHRFNVYITELENLRVRLSRSESEFYPSLLETPLLDRANVITIWGQELPSPMQRDFRIALMVADARLRRAAYGYG